MDEVFDETRIYHHQNFDGWDLVLEQFGLRTLRVHGMDRRPTKSVALLFSEKPCVIDLQQSLIKPQR